MAFGVTLYFELLFKSNHHCLMNNNFTDVNAYIIGRWNGISQVIILVINKIGKIKYYQILLFENNS